MDYYNILIAEDEPEHIENLLGYLEKENFKIFLATNGKELINLAVKLKPDIIITDWDMPVLNGIEAAIRIRKMEETRNIPIIMATGKMLSLENMQTAFAAGVNDFITKPFNNFEIIARAKSMIRYYNSLKKTMEYEKKIAELKIKNLETELTSAKMHFLQQENFINKIIEKLNEIKKLSNKKTSIIINQLISDIVTNEKAFNWKEFEAVFNKANGDFISKLEKLGSDLTPREKKLCVFLKMGMSTKEIAAITTTSTDAVTKMKYRLKKKLNLLDKTLAEYLNCL